MPRCFTLFAISLLQVCTTFGQTAEKWSASFQPLEKTWTTLQGMPTVASYDGEVFVLSFDPREAVRGKFPDFLMDYTQDFLISLELTTPAGLLEVFWNSSLSGENGIRLQLSPEEFLLTEMYQGKEKKLAKHKPKRSFDFGEKFLLAIVQKQGETSITLSQKNHHEQMKPAKIAYREKQYSTGLVLVGNQENANTTNRIAISQLAMEYVPFELRAMREMPDFGTKEKLPTAINTDSLSEFAPFINPSGEVLYFLRENENVPQVLFSRYEDKEWIAPETDLLSPPNSESLGGVLSVSEDDHVFFFQSSPTNAGVSTARMKDGSLTDIKPFSIPDQLLQVATTMYFVANSGNFILASMEARGSVGGKDLYISILNERGEFSKPIHLGATINSAGDEDTPFLAADTKTLYFSSTGLPGYGEADIYMSRRLDDTWSLWTPPVNLGKSVNSMGKEKYFSVDTKGTYGYFTAYDHTTELGDLYRIKLPLGIKPLPVTLVEGIVRDIKTNEPVQSTVTYRSLDADQNSRQVITDESGYYRMVLPENKDYGIYAEAEGYYPKSDSISLVKMKQYRAITRDLYLTPIIVEERIALNNIFFNQSRANILPQSIPELSNLYRLLLQVPSMKIRIEGHTDGIGNRQMNITLSMARANAIKEFLTEKGIASNRIRAVGYGPDRPVADNEDPESRKLNRRVEFFVTEK